MHCVPSNFGEAGDQMYFDPSNFCDRLFIGELDV